MTLTNFLCVAGIVIIFAALCSYQSAWADECRAKGGTPHCPYKSSCVCLAKGTVIE